MKGMAKLDNETSRQR